MSSISSSIRLSDQMSPAIKSMMTGMNSMIAGFERMETASAGAIDTKSMSMARSEMAKAGAAFKQFEKSVEDAEKSQKEFNSTAKASTSSMGGLIGKVGALAAGYMSLQAIQGVMDISDTYSQTTARLGLMNDGLQTTAELQTDIFKAANESHASYQSMSDMVSKLGLMAGDAFSSNDEIVDFAEQVSKQFVISGASAGETSNAMLQLTQAMASGVLRGDELNSIFENSPTLIQTIADYLGVPIGEIRNMASEGEITADIIKNSMFKAANATDAKFEAMGMTFGQAWTIFQNKSNRAFQGVFTQMGQLANSDALDGFLDGLAGGIGSVATGISTMSTGLSTLLNQPSTLNLGADINVVVTELKEEATESMEQIAEQFKKRGPEIQQALGDATNSWDNFVQRITQGNDTLKTLDWESGAADIFADWIDRTAKGAEVMGYVAAEIVDLHNLFSAIWAGDWEGANGWLTTIQDDAYQMQKVMLDSGEKSTTMYAQGVQSALPTMQAAVQQSTETAMAPMTSLPTTANQIGANTTGSFAGGLLINQGIVTSNSQGIANATTETIRPLENNMYTIGQNSTLGMAQSITEGAPGVAIAAQGINSSAITALNPLPGSLATIGASAGAGLGSSMQSALLSVPIQTEGIGTQSTAGLISGVLGNLPGVTTAGQTSAQALIDAANSTLDVNSPSKVFQTMGNYTGDGLIKGLKERESSIAAGGDAAATALKDSFKEAMGINSPSTVFRGFGYYAIDGLIEGLSSTELMTFCESIVADMKAAFESGNFNLQAGIEYLGGGAAEFFKSIGIGGASLGQLITPLAGDVTSGFGSREQFMTDSGQLSSGWHPGIDIGAAFGTPIGAAGAGTVIFAGWNGGYGNMVEIDHGNGLTSMYAHMESIAASLGQTVSAGQTIGYVGSTGNSTGPHLHFGLYQDGQAIDPSALWGYSSGTMSARAGLHLVGENGPEIIGFNGGETVLNSKKTKLFQSQGNYGGVSVSGGQGVTVQVNMNGVTISNDMDIEVVADRLGSLIVEKMRTRSSVA